MRTPPSSASDAFTLAVRLLSRCDRSIAQLRQKLEQRGFSATEIDAAIERCCDYNYLDDRRYATARVRSLMRSGKGVGARVFADLRRRGIDETLAREVLDKVTEEFCLDHLLQSELARRFPTFSYARATEKERRRVISFFQRRGFNLGDILTQLKQSTSFSDI